MALSKTTLARAIAAGDQRIYLASTAAVAVGQYLSVGREAMRVKEIIEAGLVRVRRGVRGAQTAQQSGAVVYIGDAGAFYMRDPVGPVPSPAPDEPIINLVTGEQFVAQGGEYVKRHLAQTLDGLGVLRVARATFDPSANAAQRAEGAHGLGVTIPTGAVVVGGFMQTNTAITGVGASVAISVQTANDIQAAAAISGAPWSTTGLKAIVPKANTPESTGIALTAAREITATVSAAVLTAGKVTITLYFVQGA